MTIKIYCLIHPVTLVPFYVGATNGKIETRLSSHLSEARYNYINRRTQELTYSYNSPKNLLIRHILHTQKKSPKIRLVHTCDIHASSDCELFFYLLFLSQGYIMYQDMPVGYKNKLLNSKPYVLKNKQLRKYMQLRCKDILIIIW